MTIYEIYEAVKRENCIKSYKIEREKSDKLTIFDSKFGGIPYWDFTQEFPIDSKGEKLCLLAQINFDSENFNDDRLPSKGILQFYISPQNDVYGMNFEAQNVQTDWRVVYHENVNYDITEEEIKASGIKSFKDVTPDCYTPFSESYKLRFKLVEDIISCYDEEFSTIVAKTLKSKFNVSVKENDVNDYLEKINEKYYEKFDTWGHKLLGYPAFTQSDPRYMQKYNRYNTLLLQIDSDNEIMWGDCGIANFFINKDDLKNNNFNDILYNWDCY